MKIQLPQKVDYIINQLMKYGFEAYAVGGCVRDSILGKEPEDWDITTSAKPEEVKKIFRRTIDTGILHGTVTVMLEKEGYEVTTYRIDGEYEDNRHPKEVAFTANLTEDLKRRDFTINAMAYNVQDGLVDIFGGLKDIKDGIIRCVGSAGDRFDEDALRILRAIRFSAQLGFEIEEETLEAIQVKKEHLKNISAERIRVELNKLLLSDHPDKLFMGYETGITKVILPEFDIMMVTEQFNYHHIYSVGVHTVKGIEAVGKTKEKLSAMELGNILKLPKSQEFNSKDKLVLKWTLLLHDVEKPSCKFRGKDGEDHFYGHQEKGAQTAKNILKRLKFDNETMDKVVRLVQWHDYDFSRTPAGMRKATNKIGEDIMELLFEVKRADVLAQNPDTWEHKLTNITEAEILFYEIQKKEECINLKMLAINGQDLINLGLEPGKKIGDILNKLLEFVLEKPEYNEKEILIDIAKKYIKN
jgi:tRNA nucleotidyltransferase (CCA-adding enzyme)